MPVSIEGGQLAPHRVHVSREKLFENFIGDLVHVRQGKQVPSRVHEPGARSGLNSVGIENRAIRIKRNPAFDRTLG